MSEEITPKEVIDLIFQNAVMVVDSPLFLYRGDKYEIRMQNFDSYLGLIKMFWGKEYFIHSLDPVGKVIRFAMVK